MVGCCSHRVRSGSWPCDNAPEGVSPDLDRRDALQGGCFERFFSDFGLGGKPASSSGRPDRLSGAAEVAAGAVSGRDRRHQRLDADDVHDARQIVGEHVQCHLAGNLSAASSSGSASRPSASSVCRRDRLAPLTHGVRIFVEPLLHGLDNLLVLPPRDATLFARRALGLNWACTTRVGPITAKFLAVLLSCKPIRKFLTRRAAINIFIG
jgi:hypothetical protein